MSNEELITEIRAGRNTEENTAQLYKQNAGFVRKIASRYQSYAELDDLMQEGFCGLCLALQDFDPDQEIKFITYASHKVLGCISRYVDNNSNLIRSSRGTRENMIKYKRACSSFQSRYGRKPTTRELACILEISEKKVVDLEIQVHETNLDSTDRPTGTDNLTVEDQIEDSRCFENDIATADVRCQLWEIVWTLPETEAEIIRQRYLDEKTFSEIQEYTGASNCSVQQRHRGVLRKLRNMSQVKKLSEDLEIISSRAYTGGVESFKRSWTSSTERTALYLAGY